MVSGLRKKKVDELILEFRNLLGYESGHVYYQPPEKQKMEYPCIRFSRSTGRHEYANNFTYKFTDRYEVTYIDRDPDSDNLDKIIEHFKLIRHDRHYTAENLNHDVFDLYY